MVRFICIGLLWALTSLAYAQQAEPPKHAPPSMTLSVVEPTGNSGQDRTLRYTITTPTDDASQIKFKHDISFFVFLGELKVDETSLPNKPCGDESSIILQSDKKSFEFTGGSLKAGESCTFDIRITVNNVPAGEYILRTGLLESNLGESAFAQTNIVVSGTLPAKLDVSVVEPTGVPGQDRTVRYTITAPAGYGDHSEIELEHDVAALLAGLTVNSSSLPAMPCGAGSSIVLKSEKFFSLLGGSLKAGESCTFNVGIKVAETIEPGQHFLQTGPVRSVSEGESLQSTPVFAQLVVIEEEARPPVLSLSFNPNPVQANSRTQLSYTFTMPDNVSGVHGMELDHAIDYKHADMKFDTGNAPSNPCGTGSSLNFTRPAYVEVRGGSLSAGESCTFTLDVIIPASVSAGDYQILTGPVKALRNDNNEEVTGEAVDTILAVTEDSGIEPLEVSGVMARTPLPAGQESDYIITVTNPNESDLAGIDLGLAVNANQYAPGLSFSFNSFTGAGCAIDTAMPQMVDGFPETVGVIVSGARIPAKGVCTATIKVQPKANTASGAYPVSGVIDIGESTVLYTDPDLAPVEISDGNAPMVTIPENINVNTDSGKATANVTFTVSATDTEDGAITPTITSAPTAGLTSGSDFPVGVTTITVSAMDQSGNTSEESFTVTVKDGEAPVINNVPPRQDLNTVVGEKTVSLDVTTLGVSISDNVDTGLTPVFTIDGKTISGPYDFPIGDTTVLIDANDMAGNAAIQQSFIVQVTETLDTEPPVLSLPNNIMMDTDSGKATANVTFTVSANDNVDGAITPTITSAPTAGLTSGSDFPIGVTTSTVSATDQVGNTSEESFTITVKDNDKPVITIPTDIERQTDAGKNTANVTFTVSANDNVDGAITPSITSAPTAGLASGSDFPIGVTTITVSATDQAGNTSEESFTVTVSDGEKPKIIVPGDITQAADPETQMAIVHFDVEATDNTDGALTPVISSSPTQNLVSGSSFPLGETLIMVKATDRFGNTGEDTFKILVEDRTSPTLEITAVPNTVSGAFTVIFNFSEAVDGFELDDIDVTNGSVSDFTAVGESMGTNQDGAAVYSTFSVLITPNQDGMLSITVGAGALSDLAGNMLVADVSVSTVTDTVAPMVTLSHPGLNVRGPFELTITFSEDVTGFEIGDIEVENAVVTDFSAINASEYTVEITPEEQGELVIFIPANRAVDAAGNGNEVSNTVNSVYIDEEAVRMRTQRIINNFMVRRADQITANEPNLADRLLLQGSSEGSWLHGEVKPDQVNMAFAASTNAKDSQLTPLFGSEYAERIRFWSKALLSSLRLETSDQDFFIFHAGVDYQLNKDAFIGFLGQYDWTQEEDRQQTYAVRGKGWMVGPYFVNRLTDHLIVDGRVGWGQSNNEIRPDLTYTDKFDTERVLAKGQVTGDFFFDNWRINPALSLLYFKETQEAYTDSLGIYIPKQDINFGRLTFGPQFSKDFKYSKKMTITPSFTAKGIWNFDTAEVVGLATGLAYDIETLRARIESGVTLSMTGGTRLSIKGFYDGLGVQTYESYGGSIRVYLVFN